MVFITNLTKSRPMRFLRECIKYVTNVQIIKNWPLIAPENSTTQKTRKFSSR